MPLNPDDPRPPEEDASNAEDTESDDLSDLQRVLDLRSGPPPVTPPERKPVSLQTWLIPASGAAVLAIATVILMQMPEDSPPAVVPEKPVPAALPPAEVVKLFVPVKLGPLKPHEVPELALPVQSETASMGLVSKAILQERQFPSREAVRLEEILNSFPLRLSGTAAVAGGTDSHSATLATETIPCPWKPSAILLLVSVRANPQSACEIKLTYHPTADTVFRYRLLGFADQSGKPADALPSKLAAGSATTLAIEIERSTPSGSLGVLRWTTDGNPAPEISITHLADAEPSDDARFASLVCTFGQWLTGEEAGTIDAEIVAALARESASATLPPARVNFLNLIDRALSL